MIVGEIKYCEDCGAETFNCKCNEEDDQPDLTICSVCGDEPCSCHTCRDCENNPCTCGSGGNNNEDKENENDDGNKEEGEGDNENEEDDKTESEEVEMTEEEIQLVNAAINFLKNIGVDISNVKIVKVNMCATNAKVAIDYSCIQVCSDFFNCNSKDQIAILYHETYHLNNDIRSWKELKGIEPFLATPTPDIMNCIRTLIREVNKIDESDITTWNNVYLSYVYLGTFCEQAYHENEINAYIAEITNIKDVTSIYDANRKLILFNVSKLHHI